MQEKRSIFNETYSFRDPAKQKRKNARVNLNIEAEFSLSARKDRYPCLILDIGTGGVALDTRSTVFEGDKISIFAKLYGKEVELNATVIKVSGKTANCQFGSLSEETMDLIQEVIHKKFFEKEKKLK